MQDQSPPITVKAFIESYFGYKESFSWWLVLILASFSVAFFVSSTFALYKIKWQNR